MPTTTEDAKSIYENELKESLERESHGQYVAIVSYSRRHFVRASFLVAALAAREAEPEHIPFVIRIGHKAAFHIGRLSKGQLLDNFFHAVTATRTIAPAASPIMVCVSMTVPVLSNHPNKGACAAHSDTNSTP